MVKEELRAVHALLQILEEEGVEYIFGVPGGPLTALFEAMEERGRIRLVLAKHESGAAFMAAAHARVSRSLAVCVGTSGPGATNAITGIASAYADSLPVLMLSGQVATNVFGKGAIQESSSMGIDVVNLFRPVTKMSAMFPAVERVPDTVRAAIRTAMSGRRGPVHLSMPADMLRRPLKHAALRPNQYRPQSAPIDHESLAQAAQLLATAKRPMLLAGNGVSLAGGAAELARLARTLQIPVATSPKGKGVFPESDRLSLGVLGFGGHNHAEQYLQTGGVDVLVVVGSTLNEFVTNAWTIQIAPSRALVQIDVDPTAIGRNYPVDVGVIGDARAALQELTTRTQALLTAPVQRDHGELNRVREMSPRHLAPASLHSDSTPIKPQRLIKEMRGAMPDDALLFVDNGTSIIWGTHYFEVRSPDTYFIDLGLACMGSAVAGVVGGALAARGRRAVALVGDAAFAMHGFEVHTAVEQRLPVVWVVLNNAGHGMVTQGDRLMRGQDLGVSQFRVPLDNAAMARAMGARGVQVKTPEDARAALNEALRDDGPWVIDVLIDADELAPTLVRRVENLAKMMSLSRASDPRSPLGG